MKRLSLALKIVEKVKNLKGNLRLGYSQKLFEQLEIEEKKLQKIVREKFSLRYYHDFLESLEEITDNYDYKKCIVSFGTLEDFLRSEIDSLEDKRTIEVFNSLFYFMEEKDRLKWLKLHCLMTDNINSYYYDDRLTYIIKVEQV